ncbi:MAG: hypothetical protein II313_02740, partial [Anaerotignum sp.]|nr:hypothetical protein [Anaerotignum sp.]
YDFGKVRTLSECRYFSAYELDLDGKFEFDAENFLHVLVLGGAVTVNGLAAKTSLWFSLAATSTAQCFMN